MSEQPKPNGPEQTFTFTPPQWIAYSALDLAIHVLVGQASQLHIAKSDEAESAARVLERAAKAIAEKRDKLLHQWRTGIVVVGPEVLEVLPEEPKS